MNIAEKIKTKRKESGLSQKEIAKITNISQNYISQIENGKSQPTADIIKEICNALEISANWLILDKEDEPLKKDEKELLNIYRSMSEKNKQRLIGRAENMLEEQAETENNITKQRAI